MFHLLRRPGMVLGLPFLLLLLLLPVRADAAGITVTLTAPTANQFFSDSFDITARVDSVNQIQSVVAQVDDRTVPLQPSCTTTRCEWKAKFPLEGLEKGKKTLTVTATDYYGETGQKSVSIIYDKPPVLHVEEPAANTIVIQPNVRISATATDDTGVPTITVNVNETELYTGAGSVDRSFDLSAYKGKNIVLYIFAKGEYGLGTSKQWSVYVDGTPGLALLNSFDGDILDFDEDRILWRSADEKTLWLYDRATGGETKVDEGDDTHPIGEAKLTEEGVVYNWNTVDTSEDWVTNRQLRYWEDGAVRKLHDDDALLDAAGNHAAGVYNLYHLKSGQSVDRPGNARDFDLLEDGSVVYTSETTKDLYKQLPDGTQTLLRKRGAWPSNGYSSPLSDGKNIIFREQNVNAQRYQRYFLRLLTPEGQLVSLAEVPYGYQYEPGDGYLINNGWTAYTNYINTSWNVFVRSPEGEVKQVSFLNGQVFLDQLAPNGTVTYTFNNRTYLYSTQAGKVLLSAYGPGSFRYVQGKWYRVAGNSLFEVQVEDGDTVAPIWQSEQPLTVTDVTYSSAELAWEPAFDEGGVARYLVYREEEAVASVTGDVYRFKAEGLSPSTAYRFSLVAEDASGNKSGRSPAVTVTTDVYSPGDIAAPVWPGGEALTVTDAVYDSVGLHWLPAADDTGVAGYEIYQDGRLLTTVAGSVYDYRVSGLKPETAYTFLLKARDAAGNISEGNPSVTVTTPAYVPETEILALERQPGEFLEVGSELVLDVKAPDAEDLYGFLLRLDYDRSLFKLEKTGLHADFGTQAVDAAFGQSLPAPGEAAFAGVLMGDVPGRSGDVGIVRLTFTVLKEGSGDFVLRPSSSVSDSRSVIDWLDRPVTLTVHVRSADFDGDGSVGLSDLVLISKRNGTHSGDPGFEPQYDLNGDGSVDEQDITYVAEKAAAGS